MKANWDFLKNINLLSSFNKINHKYFYRPGLSFEASTVCTYPDRYTWNVHRIICTILQDLHQLAQAWCTFDDHQQNCVWSSPGGSHHPRDYFFFYIFPHSTSLQVAAGWLVVLCSTCRQSAPASIFRRKTRWPCAAAQPPLRLNWN